MAQACGNDEKRAFFLQKPSGNRSPEPVQANQTILWNARI
jgi:hypothetical protein